MTSKVLSLLVICGLLLISCGDGNGESASGGGDVSVQDFIELYPELTLPYKYADSSFPKKETDSTLISPENFYMFTPDSFMVDVFDSLDNPNFYPVGKFNNGTDETYLITRGVSKDTRALLITAYDKELKFIAGIPIIRINKGVSSAASVSIDPRFNISKNVIRHLPGDIKIEGHDVYILNAAAKSFMLVMTDSLGKVSGPLINPIDTLPRTNKYAGDYGDGKRNLISFRDSKKEGRMELFLNLENKDKGCEGEMKGEVTFTSPTSAEYRQPGDACVLSFEFSNKNVKILEVEGCGSRLGTLECTFNGTYPKLKSPSDAGPKTTKEK